MYFLAPEFQKNLVPNGPHFGSYYPQRKDCVPRGHGNIISYPTEDSVGRVNGSQLAKMIK